METYDLVMLIVLGGATLFGFMKGFAWQVASLASLTLSYFCAYRFADQIAPMLNADPRWSKYLAMLLVYCGTGFFVWMGFRFVSGAIDKIRLREFDRQMGGLVGAAKGILLCTVITFFAVSLSDQSRAAVLRSKSGVYISTFINKATPIIPKEWPELVRTSLSDLERGLDPSQPRPDGVQKQIVQGATTGAQQAAPQILQQLAPNGVNSFANPYGATQPGTQPFGNYQPNYGQPNANPQPNYGAPAFNPYGNALQYAPQPQYQPSPYAPAPNYGPMQPSNPYSSGS